MSAPNLPTLLAIAIFAHVIAGSLLLLSWLQYRTVSALIWWGLSFLAAASAMGLIVCGRGIIPDFWSIVVGNGILAASYGMLWWGARTFEGRAGSILLGAVGVLTWLAVCLFGPLYSRPEARATVMAAIAIGYLLLAFREIWRGRDDGMWRWPMLIVLLLHAAAIPVRIPLAIAPMHPSLGDIDLQIFAIVETVFIAIAGAYLLGSLVRDRLVRDFRNDAQSDALTGIRNRRAFMQIGERLFARARFGANPAALIICDLDRFKCINDTFGHGVGDEVLVAFCRLAAAQLRPDDLFARIGGEEFASFLPNTSREAAVALAERIRVATESAFHRAGERTFRFTVSIGVAFLDSATTDLAELLKMADQALYRAKTTGRNRAEASSPRAECGPDCRVESSFDRSAA